MGTVGAWIVVVAIGALAVYAWADDPHWCSKDGRRFLCRVLPVPDKIGPRQVHRWLECRASIDADDTVQLFIRRGFSRRHIGPCRVIGRGDPQGRKAVFVLDGVPPMQLRLPASSRAVETLAALVSP